MMKAIAKVSLAFLAVSAIHAQATEVRLDGEKFDVIYDDSTIGYFGVPKLVGNTFYFTPTQFSAASISGQGWSVLHESLGFTVVADAGHHIGGASLVEEGDYSFFGPEAFASVSGELRAVTNVQPDLSQDADLIGAEDLLATKKGKLKNWSSTAVQTFQGDVTSVDFTVENVLFAYSEKKKDYAFIEKKYIGFTVVTVPEADTWAMLLGGLGMIGAIARRRMGGRS